MFLTPHPERWDTIRDAAAWVSDLPGWQIEINGTLIEHVVENWGALPEETAKTADENTLLNVLGSLFAALGDARDAVISDAERMSADGICPALVGVVGPGAKPNTFAMAWPLFLPLAQYIEV
jgi:hypothetical protein